MLYRKNRPSEAAHRYQYALKKINPLISDEGLSTPTQPVPHEQVSAFVQLKTNLLLNLSRCKRKLNVSISKFQNQIWWYTVRYSQDNITPVILCQCYCGNSNTNHDEVLTQLGREFLVLLCSRIEFLVLLLLRISKLIWTLLKQTFLINWNFLHTSSTPKNENLKSYFTVLSRNLGTTFLISKEWTLLWKTTLKT